MICLLEAGAAPAAVAGLALVDPVFLPLVPAWPDRLVTPMLAAYAAPVVGPLLMHRRRMSPEALVASVLSLCCVDAARVPADVVAAHVTVPGRLLRRPRPRGRSRPQPGP